MNNLLKGVVAGLVATIVLSLLMIMKAKMGLMPDLNVIKMLASKMGGMLALGWVAHIVIGLVYGVLFASFQHSIPTSGALTKGLILGVAGWLMMMIVIMPMMGVGIFATQMGMMAPVMTLILHLIFGATLGFTFKKLNR